MHFCEPGYQPQTKLSDIFWKDFIALAKPLYEYDEEATVYDVFMLFKYREGDRPSNPKLMDVIDREIENEFKLPGALCPNCPT